MNNAYTCCKIIREIVEDSNPVLKDLSERGRENRKPEIRFMYFYFCRKYIPSASLATIGSVAGDYDHATVLHGVKQMENFLEYNGLHYVEYFEQMEKIIQHLDFSSDLKPLRQFQSKGEIIDRYLRLTTKYRTTISSLVIKLSASRKKNHLHEEIIKKLNSKIEENNSEISLLKNSIYNLENNY